MLSLLGQSPPHRQLLDKLARVAPTDAEVLISGPTGVGKELAAHHVHKHSKRAAGPFVAVNCGAIPAELFENELFGHRGGAYTSAQESRDGMVAEAEHGTLFLDEVDSLAPPNQVKLLRFIQQKEYRRLGDSRVRKADLRFIAATNTSLTDAISAGRFRSDLYYRLSVFPVEVAPLSARKEDVALLLEHFADRYAKEYELPRIVLSPDALLELSNYAWPGNVRELENCVKYLTCLQLDRQVHGFDLPMYCARERSESTEPPSVFKSFSQIRSDLVTEFERSYVLEVLRRHDGNVTRAAQACGEYRKKLERLMKKHGLSAKSTE